MEEQRAYFRKKSGRTRRPARKAWIAVSAAALLLTLFILINLLIEGPIESVAKKRISAAAAKLLNDSLKEVMTEYSLSGGAAFAEQVGSEDGTFLYIDAVGMNLMAGRIVERAQSKMAELAVSGVKVALGSASGLPVLNGAGPMLNVAIEPLGEVSSRFSSAFESAGVNQTRYRATLMLSASVEMILFGRSREVSAEISAPICETILVGGVPAAYTNVESMEDALNLIPSEAPERN